jgi:hypothetical protein
MVFMRWPLDRVPQRKLLAGSLRIYLIALTIKAMSELRPPGPAAWESGGTQGIAEGVEP